MSTTPALKTVDRVEIVTVLDNTIDLLLGNRPGVRRVPAGRTMAAPSLMAEHGFSALVKVRTAEHDETVLFDAGLSVNGLSHNLEVLELKPQEFHSIVLSHGHTDHSHGLIGLVSKLGPRRMPLLLHPDAFLERKTVRPDGHEIDLPPPDRTALVHDGIDFVEERGPSYLMGGLILITGQIHRATEFEKGLASHFAYLGDHWAPDPLVHDDQALVVNLRGRGLVILTGCGHAGAINTIRQAQQLAGESRVAAVLGGFHLSGPLFEPVIAPTIAALHEIQPSMIVPAHCTGWKATHAIAREFPEAFVQNSVGTTFVFEAAA